MKSDYSIIWNAIRKPVMTAS